MIRIAQRQCHTCDAPAAAEAAWRGAGSAPTRAWRMTRRKRFGARTAARPKRAAKPSGAAYEAAQSPRVPDKTDRTIDDLPARVGCRHVQFVDFHLGEEAVKRVLVVARLDPVEQHLGIGEEFALVAVGGQVPKIPHD